MCRFSAGTVEDPSTPQPHSSPLAALGPLSLTLGPLSFPHGCLGRHLQRTGSEHTWLCELVLSLNTALSRNLCVGCGPYDVDFPECCSLCSRSSLDSASDVVSDKVPVFPPPARSAPGPRPPGPRRHRPARGDSSHGLVPPQRPARPRRMPPGARLALPTATDPVGLGFGRASCRLQPVSRTLSVRPPPPRGARRHCWNQTHLSALALSRRTPSP